MFDYSKLTKEQLIEKIERLQSGLPRLECTAEMEHLVHELQVHQIELEMQNRELQEAQQQLEESRDRYADLYDFAPVGYLTLDENGCVRGANLTAAALLGRNRASLIGKPFVSWLEQGESESFFVHLRLAFRDPSNAAAELKIRRGGEIRHVLLESAALRKSAEHPRNCRTVMIDITEQKQLGETLYQSRAQKKALLDMIPAAVYIKDRNLRYVSVNQSFADSLKRSTEDMIGKTTFEAFPREIAENFDRSDRAVLQSGKVIANEEQQVVDALGNRLWISTSKAPYYGPDGQVAGLAGISMDITPIREAELRAHELLRENRRLTRRLFAVQEKERRHLARELHDELGQWLTAIQVEAQAVRTMNCAKGNSSCQEGTQSIIDSTAQLHQVVRRILHRLRPSLLDQLGLADSLRELVSQWQGSHSGIDCDLILDDTLEGLDERLEITLYRVVQEGLTNVSTHSGADRVSIAMHRAPNAIMLSLQDNGKGMADTQTNRHGLGLLGMRERVIAAEGEFAMHSTPGQGLRIDVMLPLTLSEDNNENLRLEDRKTD